jgi:ribokinase
VPELRFVAVGDVMADVLVRGHGHGATVRLAPGGTAVNAASAAARMGARAEVVGRIGDDAAGRMILAELVERGIRASVTLDRDRPTGTFLVIDGEIRVDRGANLGLTPEEVPPVLDADVTLVSGHLREDTVAASLARSEAAWNALAPGLAGGLAGGGNAVLVNAEEARALTGENAEEAARVLGRRYRLACVTRGAAGVVGMLDGTIEIVEPARVVADDRPGTGDAFAAAVLLALAGGACFRDALAEGCRMGALEIDEAPSARE